MADIVLKLRPRLLVSACLMGQNVRYDGRNKRHFGVLALAEWLDLVPLCPEVAIGLGVPRPPIQLLKGENGTRLVEVTNPGHDHTRKMAAFVEMQIPGLELMDGWIAKRHSPSCGLDHVPVHGNGELRGLYGQGAFSGPIHLIYPELPVSEEQYLDNAPKRENFLLRVYTHGRWRNMGGASLSKKALLEFHHAHRFLIMARSFKAYQRLGNWLEDREGRNLSVEYFRQMMTILKRKERRSNLIKILHKIMRESAGQLDSRALQRLSQAIENYRQGAIAVTVPLALLGENLSSVKALDLAIQLFIEPFPQRLMAESKRQSHECL